MELKFEKFTIRNWQAGDELSLVHNTNNRKIWRNVRDTFPHPQTDWQVNTGLADLKIVIVTHSSIKTSLLTTSCQDLKKLFASPGSYFASQREYLKSVARA